MVAYWTGPEADPAEAKRLAESRKVVFSKTLEKADWGRVTISRGDDLAAEVAALRRETDRDVTILGSANLTNAFLKAGLIDGFRLLVTPLLLGGGTRLFQDNYDRLNLKLAKAQPLDSGAVVLEYERPA
jgi:dihydrofolate reductase